MQKLQESGKEVIFLNFQEIGGFAGNCLELVGSGDSKGDNNLVLAISTKAITSLSRKNTEQLEKHLQLVKINVNTIEHVGGGGIRGMLAGVHLTATL